MRITRKQPFCWQEKKINRLIRKNYTKNSRSKMLLLYATLTEIDNDFNGEDIKYYTKTIATYSGLSKEFIPTGLKELKNLGIISIIPIKEKGKFLTRKLVFTPENVADINLKVSDKTIPEKALNGKADSLEESSSLEEKKYIIDNSEKVDNKVEEILNYFSSEVLRQKGFCPKVNKKTDGKLVEKFLEFIGSGKLYRFLKVMTMVSHCLIANHGTRGLVSMNFEKLSNF